MRIVIQYKSADKEFLTEIVNVELPEAIAVQIRDNRNAMLENRLVVTLVSELTVGNLIISPLGPR